MRQHIKVTLKIINGEEVKTKSRVYVSPQYAKKHITYEIGKIVADSIEDDTTISIHKSPNKITLIKCSQIIYTFIYEEVEWSPEGCV